MPERLIEDFHRELERQQKRRTPVWLYVALAACIVTVIAGAGAYWIDRGQRIGEARAERNAEAAEQRRSDQIDACERGNSLRREWRYELNEDARIFATVAAQSTTSPAVKELMLGILDDRQTRLAKLGVESPLADVRCTQVIGP